MRGGSSPLPPNQYITVNCTRSPLVSGGVTAHLHVEYILQHILIIEKYNLLAGIGLELCSDSFLTEYYLECGVVVFFIY